MIFLLFALASKISVWGCFNCSSQAKHKKSLCYDQMTRFSSLAVFIQMWYICYDVKKQICCGPRLKRLSACGNGQNYKGTYKYTILRLFNLATPMSVS